MKLYKFLRKECDKISEKKFSVKDEKEFNINIHLYKVLLELSADKNIDVNKVCDIMTAFNFHPSLLSQDHSCKRPSIDCLTCWKNYIEPRIQPFIQTKIHKQIYGKKAEREIEMVSSQEYKDWIYDYIEREGYIDSESLLYSKTDKDKEYGKMLGVFLMYINDLVAESDCENIATGEDFEAEKYIFKLKDNYYDIVLLIGQGSCISINKIDQKITCLNLKNCIEL